jgi:hypothetical protein
MNCKCAGNLSSVPVIAGAFRQLADIHYSRLESRDRCSINIILATAVDSDSDYLRAMTA